MRVGQSGGDVHLELLVVVNVVGSEFDGEAFADLDQGLAQDVVESGVEIHTYILKQDGLTLGDGVFDLLEEVSVFGISDDQIVAHLLDPLVSLILGINVQGPSETLFHEDTILS